MLLFRMWRSLSKIIVDVNVVVVVVVVIAVVVVIVAVVVDDVSVCAAEYMTPSIRYLVEPSHIHSKV